MNADVRAVQKSERHIAHRLKSIAWDARRCEAKLTVVEDTLAEQVNETFADHRLRFMANLRCGEWYLPAHSYFRNRRVLSAESDAATAAPPAPWHADAPLLPHADEAIATQCYFKSSDGHYGKWAFSTTRLNLGCLRMGLVSRPTCEGEAKGGMIDVAAEVRQPPETDEGSVVVVVDATQHGKAYPDALSKTVPIWACVMSLVYGGHGVGRTEDGVCIYEATAARFLPPWVHHNEVLSIAQRLPAFVAEATAVLPASPHAYRLSHPLHIEWAHAEDAPEVWAATAQRVAGMARQAHVLLLVCCSGDAAWGGATGTTTTGPRELPMQGRGGWSYVRGAADDHQSWGMGLDAALFWANEKTLTDPLCSNDDIERAVVRIVAEAASQTTACSATLTADAAVAQLFSRSVSVATKLPTVGGRMVDLHVAVGVVIGNNLADEGMWSSSPQTCVLCVEEGRSRDTQPTVLFQGPRVLSVAVDSLSTKVGVERALVLCMRWVMDAVSTEGTPLPSCPEGTGHPSTPETTALFLVCRRTSDLHLAASVALATRVLLLAMRPVDCGSVVGTGGNAQRVTKQSIRQHQAAISDALGPSAIVRSDMVQVNRYFLSKYDDRTAADVLTEHQDLGRLRPTVA